MSRDVERYNTVVPQAIISIEKYHGLRAFDSIQCINSLYNDANARSYSNYPSEIRQHVCYNNADTMYLPIYLMWRTIE